MRSSLEVDVTGPSKRNWPRLAARAVIAVALLWLVVTKTFVAFLAESSPATAVALGRADAVALIATAQQKIAVIKWLDRTREQAAGGDPKRSSESAAGDRGGVSAETRSTGPSNSGDRGGLWLEARELAIRAIALDPLDARGIRTLGELNILKSGTGPDAPGTNAYFEQTARLSLHESDAIYWLMREKAEAGDLRGALQLADVLLRTRSAVLQYVMPVLVRAAEQPGTVELVKGLLAVNPPWRAGFFSELPNYITDARTPLVLLTAVRGKDAAGERDGLRTYLNFLLQKGFYDLAYQTWLQFLADDQLRDVRLIFNGDFSQQPSGLPFDWQLVGGASASIEIAEAPDDRERRALRIEFRDGRVEFGGVSQSTVLPPGRYRLSGDRRGELIGRRGLRWRMFCNGASQVSAESAMVTGAAPKWQPFAFEFVVPAEKCGLQRLALILDARSPSEKLVTGTMWYRALRLERIGQ